MKTPRAITRVLAVAALFLATLIPASVTAPTPARAGLDACVALATDFGLSDVKKAANFVVDHGECLGDLTNPSFLAVVAAVIMIEATTSAYSDGNSCNAALGGIAGKPIAAALSALASALGLPDSVNAELASFASDQGAQGLIQFMNATPGLNVISNNWSCACAVRYSGVAETLAKIVKDTLECTGGILESGTDAIGNFFEGWGELVHGTGLTPRRATGTGKHHHRLSVHGRLASRNAIPAGWTILQRLMLVSVAEQGNQQSRRQPVRMQEPQRTGL